MNYTISLAILTILSLFLNGCLKTETSCKKEADKEFYERCNNQFVTELVNSPNENFSEVIKKREVQDICLLAFIFYRDQREYCNQPFIYWQNEF